MIKYKLGVFLFFVFQTLTAQEQVELQINFDEVQLKVENKDSKFYYPRLLERFNTFDETLTLEEYSLIYYGFTFQENYLKNHSDESRIDVLLNAEQFDELVIECEKILKLNPVSLSANNNMGFALYKLNKAEAEYRKFQNRYRAIRKVIAYSGNGLTCESSLKVISIADEYNMIRTYFHIDEIYSQRLVGLCDNFQINPSDNFQNSEIFFDISRKLLRQEKLKRK